MNKGRDFIVEGSDNQMASLFDDGKGVFIVAGSDNQMASLFDDGKGVFIVITVIVDFSGFPFGA